MTKGLCFVHRKRDTVTWKLDFDVYTEGLNAGSVGLTGSLRKSGTLFLTLCPLLKGFWLQGKSMSSGPYAENCTIMAS